MSLDWSGVAYHWAPESLQHNTDNDTAEVRVYIRIPARHLWLAGTREPEESPNA